MIMTDILLDGFFAAIAAIGFGSISNVPVQAFKGCALLAAAGHATRFVLTHACGWGLIPAAFIGALVIGFFAPKASRHWRIPAEALAFPALLPMIPGMYAYRSVEGLLQCIMSKDAETFTHAFYLFSYNGMVCVIIVILMVLGATVPIIVDARRQTDNSDTKTA